VIFGGRGPGFLRDEVGVSDSGAILAVAEIRVLELLDGRELSWAEYGQPDGTPVMVFHGSPGTRCFCAAHEEMSLRRRVRLIAPDRPGYGHSTFDPRRNYETWAGDVGQLADYLGIERLAVLGVSSGGPNAAGCARFLGKRVSACAIVSSPAPPEAAVPTSSVQRTTRVVRRGALLFPRAVGLGFEVLLREAQRAPDKAVATMSRALPSWDAAVFNRPEIRQAARDELALWVSPTAGRAAVQDLRLELKPWGFRIQEIVSVPVSVWHGESDGNVPVASAQYQASAIPGAVLRLVPGVGHLLVHKHFGEILDDLVS
jgi:pimeloyl-ACP methyl ester carboxylesterase